MTEFISDVAVLEVAVCAPAPDAPFPADFPLTTIS
jgi:hypothetical protein